VLTDTAGYAANNVNTAPAFVRSYFNGGRSSITIPESTTLEAPAAFDEGGNFIRPQFGPLSVQADDGSFFGNYHLNAGVAGRSLIAEYGSQASIPLVLRTDFDGQNRAPGGPHRGADQKPATVPPPVTPLPQQ
jgi:hypothetical protein